MDQAANSGGLAPIFSRPERANFFKRGRVLTKKYIAGDAIYACATKLFAEQAKNPAFAGRLMIEPQ